MSLNPYCEIAVEEAIRQKSAGVFSTITGLSIGPPEYFPYQKCKKEQLKQ